MLVTAERVRELKAWMIEAGKWIIEALNKQNIAMTVEEIAIFPDASCHMELRTTMLEQPLHESLGPLLEKWDECRHVKILRDEYGVYIQLHFIFDDIP